MIKVDISNARTELYELASSCIKDDNVIKISTKKGNAILMSEAHYKNLMESLRLAVIPGVYESIEEGVNTPIEDCTKLQWK